jgi:hypothetical protein
MPLSRPRPTRSFEASVLDIQGLGASVLNASHVDALAFDASRLYIRLEDGSGTEAFAINASSGARHMPSAGQPTLRVK